MKDTKSTAKVVMTAEEALVVDLSRLKSVMESKQNLSSKKGN